MPSAFGKEFDRVARWAKRSFGPFRLVTAPRLQLGGESCSGACHFANGKWLIEIDRSQSTSEAIDTLLHELGHMVAGEKNMTERRGHGSDWGRAHARVYRAFLAAHENGEFA